jgi:alpha-glucosidase
LAEAASNDNNVEADGIFSDQTSLFMAPTEPNAGDNVRIRLRVFKNDITAAEIRLWTGTASYVEMTYLAGDDVYDYWQGTIEDLSDVEGGVWYHFKIRDGSNTKYYNLSGVTSMEKFDRDFQIQPGFRTAQWAKNGIFYQIMVDRFYDGDSSNNVTTCEYPYGLDNCTLAQPWGAEPETPAQGRDFFGGDLNGVQAKLDYLQELGVTILYLNPIFKAPSNDKYHTQDFFLVDEHFGGDEALANLMHDAHERGMRVVLDGVFNHTGDWSQWFDRANQYKTYGAFESKSSEWSNFYTFNEWPYDFCYWSGFSNLPKLNYAEQDVRNIIYQSDRSVARYWITDFNIDGWRLDVPDNAGPECDCCDMSIWQQFRPRVKAARPDAYISGEIWQDSKAFLKGDTFDAVMNYNGFCKPLLFTVANKDTDGGGAFLSMEEFNSWYTGVMGDNPTQANMAEQNLIDSHDTIRFLSAVDNNTDKFKLAVTMQMTLVGAPMIYYADEIGMSGGLVPENRRTFSWKKTDWNMDIQNHYLTLTALRRQYSALRTGSFMPLYVDASLYAYGRFDGQAKFVVAVNNRGVRQTLDVPVWKIGSVEGHKFREEISGSTYTVSGGKITLNLRAYETAVLRDLAPKNVLPAWIDPEKSSIKAADATIAGAGSGKTTISVIPYGPDGAKLGSNQNVYFEASAGRISSAVREKSGQYDVTLESQEQDIVAVVSAWVNGVRLSNTATVKFSGTSVTDPIWPCSRNSIVASRMSSTQLGLTMLTLFAFACLMPLIRYRRR